MRRYIVLIIVITLVAGLSGAMNVQAKGSDAKAILGELADKGDAFFKEAVRRFSDMGSHWADVTAGKLVELGVIKGYGDGTFKPDNTITRAEFSTIVRKAFKYEEAVGNSFEDTDTHWAKNEIHTLVQAGVIDKSEYGTSYNPDQNITRLEMAKMIVRAIDLGEQAEDMAGEDTEFIDNSDIPPQDRGYIIIASDNEIINGYPDLTFKPYGEATRAEASTMVINALDYMTEIEEEMEEYKNEDGLVDAGKLPKESFEEEGLEDIEDELVFERDGIDQTYHPEDIVDVDEKHFPLEYEGLKIESYRFDAYEDTFLKGTNSFYWGRGMAYDLFIVEGEILDERATSRYEAVFLNKDNEILKKLPSKYIAGNQVNDPMNKKALENYPNLPVSEMGIGTLKDSGKVTLMYMISSDDADKVKTVLLYYKGHESDESFESDVLKLEID